MNGGFVMQRESLESVFLANRAKLDGFLQSLGASDASEDILQELWLRLRRIDADGVEHPLPYLYRMAHNIHLDSKRGQARTAARDRLWGTSRDDVTQPHDRTLIAREELRAVDRALDALGEPTAGIFRRHRVAGVSQRQVASDYGVGLSTVERHLRRAYAALVALREGRDEA
ncbi:MAG: polymerase, sigma-24 subunit, subfamily [Bradyrhizobium sp.]|nr:polymerase, sigma-24 subunit, subfamily [Bradyrhizobium sp.]